MRAKVAALLIVLVFAIESFPVTLGDPSTGPSFPTTLAITAVPATLPADNSTYAALVVSLLDKTGAPTIAVNDTLVHLTSSLESVGKVQPTITVGFGTNFAIANFTTTKTPGETVISASASGLKSATSRVNTLVARGYPTQLTITAVPNTVLAVRKNIGALIIELQDDAGLPAKGVSDTTINLYSSNRQVLNVMQPSTTIQAGQFLRLVNYTTGFIPGQAVVTASASGFGSGSTPVTVLGLPPLGLKLYAQPTTMAACIPELQVVSGACLGRLVIAVTDSAGNPVPAPRDITVFIRSSDLQVVKIPNDKVNIQVGNISTTATFETTQEEGSAEISVSSPSLQSDFAIITTGPPTTTPLKPGQAQIKLYVGPAVVLANHRSYSSVVVSLMDGPNPAVNSTGPTTIVLTSSLTAIGNITTGEQSAVCQTNNVCLTIPPWHNFAATVFTSTFQIGTTSLTASAHNLMHDKTSLGTFGPIPAKMVLKSISSALPADGSAHSALEISLQDSFGSPALAPGPGDLIVNLSSSQNGIAKVFPTRIRVGQSFAITNVTTGVIPGTANVSAVARLSSGYIVSSTLMKTVVPAPSALGAYVAPAKGIFDRVHDAFFVIQLLDTSGNPARARVSTGVTITSSNTTVFDKTLQVTLNPGVDLLKVPIKTKVPGTSTLTLSSPGLTSTSVDLTLLPLPYVVQISPVADTIFANQTASITVSAQLLGKAVKGVQVNWNSSSGALSSTNSSTGAAGTASAVFTPSGPGEATIVATLVHPILGSVNATSTIFVQALPIIERPSLLQLLLTFPYVLGIVGAAIGVVIALLLVLRRRRRRRKGGETGEDAGFDLAVSAFPLRRMRLAS